MSDRPLVLYNEPLAQVAVNWLQQRCEVVQCAADDPQFDEQLRRADALIVRTYLEVDAALLARGPKLRVVGRAGIGLDNIDADACRSRGIEVVYTPQASTQAVVEYVTALIFDALRPRQALPAAPDQKRWSELRRILVGRRQLDECTVGILGFGRIGSHLGRALSGFGCRVVYNDLCEIAESSRSGALPVDVEALFADSDIISVHVDGRASNRQFVSEWLLSRMKGDAVFINTSRGFVVDAAALAEAMRSRPEAQAMIDVHDPEPFAGDYPLLGLPNVKLFPHLASRTETGLVNMSWVVRDVAAVLEGRAPQFPAPQ